MLLDAMVKIADKLLELAKYQELRREKRFKTWIEPMFALMTTVHQDYLLIFDEVRLELWNDDRELSEILSKLVSLRTRLEATRTAISARAFLDRDDRRDDVAANEFIKAVRQYLVPIKHYSLTRGAVLALRLVEVEKRLIHSSPGAARVAGRSALREERRRLQKDWRAVTTTYAKALDAYS